MTIHMVILNFMNYILFIQLLVKEEKIRLKLVLINVYMYIYYILIYFILFIIFNRIIVQYH